MYIGKRLAIHLPGDDDLLSTLVAHLAGRHGNRVVEYVALPESRVGQKPKGRRQVARLT